MRSLPKGADFERAYGQGRVLFHPLIRLHCLRKEESEGSLVGFVVGRRFGKAARRNRIKRLLREGWREAKAPEHGFDFIVAARPLALEADVRQLRDAILEVLGRLEARRR